MTSPTIGGSLEVKYGLPRTVKFCTRCVISNQGPNSAVEYAHTADSPKDTIAFDGEGVCDGCRFGKRKRTAIDWDARAAQSRRLCDRFRCGDGGYDCLVPRYGGKGGFCAAHVLNYQFSLHRFADEIFACLSMPARELPDASRAFDHSKITGDRFPRPAGEFRSPPLEKQEDGNWKLQRAVWHER